MRKVICIDDVVDILGFGKRDKELTYGKLYEITSFYEKKPDSTSKIN